MHRDNLSGPLFDQISRAEWSKLMQIYGVEERTYESECYVTQQGSPCKEVVIVKSGLLQSELTDTTLSRALMVENLSAGAILSPETLFLEEGYWPVGCRTIRSTAVWIIEKQAFVRMLSEHPQMMVNFIRLLSEKKAFYSDRLKYDTLTALRGCRSRRILYNSALRKQGVGKPSACGEKGEKRKVTIDRVHQALKGI